MFGLSVSRMVCVKAEKGRTVVHKAHSSKVYQDARDRNTHSMKYQDTETQIHEVTDNWTTFSLV